MGFRRRAWGRPASPPESRGSARLGSVPAAAAVVLVLLLVTACGGAQGTSSGESAAAPSPTPRAGGVLDFPLQSDPGSFAPFALETDLGVAHQIYEGLVAYRSDGNGAYATVPCLAESWSANDDATVWTFRLRRGVMFQAPVSREVTARDVVADIRFAADPANESATAFGYVMLAGTDDGGHARPGDLGVEAIDRYTVRFTLKGPYASFPDTLGGSWAWVWPVDYLRRVGRERFDEQPVGTGPFVLSHWVRGSEIDLARNPSWWNAASGQPYVDGVHFRVFKSVAAQLRAFQEGSIDFTYVPQGQVAASRSLPRVKSGEWVARSLPNLAMWFVGFNMRDAVVGGDRGLLLRQAVDCAIDRETLVAAVSSGTNVPQTGLVPPVLVGWRETAPPQAYDPARAARLYREAGEPELELTYPEVRTARTVAAWLQSTCAAAGIRLRLRPTDWDTWVGAMQAGRGPAMFVIGWMALYPSVDEFLYTMYHSSQSPYTSGTCYANEDVDRLLALSRSVSDAGRLADLNHRIAREIQADVPVIPLYENADYGLIDGRVGGFRFDPLGVVDMWELWLE